MACRTGINVIACGPDGVYRRLVRQCPECNRRHRFVESWDGAWYGTTLYGSCGDRWQEGWRAPRPARQGWRKDAQEGFRALWKAATTPRLYHAYTDADIRTATAHTDDEVNAAFIRRDAVLALIRGRDQ